MTAEAPSTEPDIRAFLQTRTAGPAGFSPTGEHVLISSDLPGSAQLYRLPAGAVQTDGVEIDALEQLTDLPEPVGGGYLPVAPAGVDTLLLGVDAGGNEKHQLYLLPLDDGPGPDGVVGAPYPLTSLDALIPLVVDPDHIHRSGGFSRDGALFAYATNRRAGADFDVWVRDVPAGTEELVHAPGGWTWAGGFSPDARYLSLGALTEAPGDSTLHLLDRSNGVLTEIAPHTEPAEVGAPTWLPDSSAFFLAHDVDRDTAVLARGTPDGALREVLDLGWETGAVLDWTGRHLLVAANVDGATQASLHDPSTLDVTAAIPLPGAGVAGGFQFSRDGRYLTYSYSSPLVPGDGWRFDTVTGASDRLTRSPHQLDPAALVAPELVRIPAHDGEQIPAYVFRPRGAVLGRRPVVLVMHGGPEGQYRPSFAALTQYLIARGFAVVAPNVRGSTGYGRRYQALDDVEKRYDSITDMASVHAWIAASDDLDPGRAAIYGGSYGGYMVLAGLAFQPELWAAGVCVVGMSSLVTFLENTAVWRRAFREREYGSLERDRDLLERLSPINALDAMRAPLFLVHGANDPRVPVSEAEQIHAALRGKGVRSELAVYPDEGHGLAKLTNRLDAYPRVAQFLVEVLRP
ncbi:MAG: S9 family peptidase [Sporichthyaceae bacterium]